jgi:hypothetical protein
MISDPDSLVGRDASGGSAVDGGTPAGGHLVAGQSELRRHLENLGALAVHDLSVRRRHLEQDVEQRIVARCGSLLR